MKRKVVVALVSFAVITIASAGLAALSKTPAPSKAWSIIHVDPNAVAPVQDQTPVVYSPVRPTAASALVTIPNNPDVAVTNATNTTQSENSVFVSPTNPQIVLNSNNSSDWPVTQIFGASYWVSTNGGSTWTGSTAGAGGTNSGDPATAIDRNGRMFIGYISSSGGMGISYSTNNGSSWTARTVSSKGSLDKNHMTVDNSATSAFSGRVYETWTNFLSGDPNVNDIELSRSADGGVTWSSAVNISNAINAGSHNQGVNVQTGPNGEVYAVWAVYDAWPVDENALGFAKSTDGGVTWAAATRIISNIRGVRITGLGGSKTMRVASFPSMAVNQQTGKIYVVWPNIGTPGVNSGDADVYMISSTNGGSSWTSPVRVNQDAQGNGKDQWQAWIACDPVTGDVSCIYYDSRNFTSNNAAETFVAVSQDNGGTWSDGKVSDFSWAADGIVGFSGNYAGDYIGISANNGNVYPCWGDNHAGNMRTYVSPFTLTSGPVPPVAQFVGSPTSGCAPLTVNFTDQSTGGPTSWSWTFGDGGTSTLQNPSHVYAAAGSYTVALTATNAQGSNTNTKINYITASPGAPVADFSGTPTTGTAPLTVNFTDLSTNVPTTWSWTFGDGGTSTAQNPSHVYNLAGTYTVALTATNVCGSNTNTKVGYITVSAAPPVAQFVGSPTSGCPPLTVNFTDQSTGSPTSWAWDFGDGGTSTLQNPSHVYAAAGSYTVALTATNAQGSNTNTKINYITVNTGAAPVADFSGTPTTGTAPLTVNFTDLSTGGPSSWSWTFGDAGTSTAQNPSHTYTSAGTYTVALTASNACGSNTNTKVGYITASPPPQQCDDFNDGDISNWGNSSGTWTATGGVMNGNSNTSNARRTSPFGSFTSVTIDCDVRMNTGRNKRTARVIFAYVDGSNYRFVEGDDGNNRWRIYDRVAGSNTVRLTVNQTINTAQWYHVTVTASSNGNVTMGVGGVTLGSYQFASAVSGLIGCGFDKSNSDFDNFCVGAAAGVVIGPGDGVADDPQGKVAPVPSAYTLEQNYPNPFNAGTDIRFILGQSGDVQITVYDILGREVRQLVSGYYPEGPHTVAFDAADDHGAHLASGMYFYRLTTPGFSETKKMVLLK